MLRFLDAMGKYVITDTQMVILLVVAFHFSIVGEVRVDTLHL